MGLPRLYDTDEAAAILQVSKSWLYKRAGQSIPVTRIAHRLLWTEEQLLWIIQAAAIEPRAPIGQPRPAARASRIPAPAPPVHPPAPRTNGRTLMAKPHKNVRTNSIPIPVADFTVSRLYKDRGDAP